LRSVSIFAYLFSISRIIMHAESLPASVIPPQLAVYPVPGFTSLLDCKPNDYVPVNPLIFIYCILNFKLTLLILL
jgi:hypothetical protein